MSFTSRRALWWGLRRVVAPLAAFLLLATQLVLPTPAEAATITFRSAATAVSAGEGVLEIDTPAGVEPDDLLIAQIVWPHTRDEVSPPDGWKLIRSDADPGATTTQTAFFRIATAEEPASHVWASEDINPIAGGIAAYVGTDTAAPIADHRGSEQAPDAKPITVPGPETTTPNGMLIGLFSIGGPGAIKTPQGMDQRWRVSSVDETGATTMAEGEVRPLLELLLADQTIQHAGDTGARLAKTKGGAAPIGQLITLIPATNPGQPQPADEPEPTDEPAPDAPPAEKTKPNQKREKVKLSPDKLRLPMTFEENHGQVAPEVDYLARGHGYSVFLDDGNAMLALGNGEKGYAIRMALSNGGSDTAVAHVQQPGSINYFIGSDPAGWQTKVPTFAAVEYQEVYPGIDLRYYGNDRQLEYDFIVQPGADPTEIALEFAGATSLEVTEDGDLEIGLNPGRTATFSAPVSFQDNGGIQIAVNSSYVLDGDTVTFALGEYDPDLPLVIDPTLQYGSYLGGAGTDAGEAIELDGSGNMVIVGYSASTDFPVTVGAYDESANGSNDVVVTKLSADGSTLLWSTYLGGSALDNGKDVAIDGSGAVYVGVYTASSDFPTTGGVYDTGLNGSYDGAVAKLSADGSTLVYSTYLGGSASNDYLRAIAVDASGQAIVAGATDSSDFPTVGGSYDTSFGGNFDAFVTKLDTTGTGLVWSTFIGGSGSDGVEDLVLDGSGTLYLTGQAASGFPATAGAYDSTVSGTFDGHATKLSSDGTTLLYATVFGGSSSEKGTAIAAFNADTLYVGGDTPSSDFPTTAGAYDTTKSTSDDMFALKLDLTQTGSAQLDYSTFIGGAGVDRVGDIAVDASNRAHVFGYTQSTGLATAGAYDTTLGGSSDTALAILAADGSAMEELTYVGGDGDESVAGLHLTINSIYLTGNTSSAAGFPITGAYDSTLNGSSDGFVVRFAALDAPIDASVVTVNSTGDSSDTNPGDDVCDTGGTVGAGAECTLRAAIEEANASATVDTIHFDIPTSDSGYVASPLSYTIQVGVPSTEILPAITAPLTLDGTSQPGFPGTPIVVLDGTATTTIDTNGITLEAGSSTIRGLVIVDFPDDAIELDINGGNTVVGNYIGIDPDGTTVSSNGWGVAVKSNGNTIGGPTALDRNTISGNSNYGLSVYEAATGNVVQGNFIGTDATGVLARGNGAEGVLIEGSASSNTIGGTDAGAGNTIASNSAEGVAVREATTTSNAILGNSIRENGGLGINLGVDAVTANDSGDGDSGPNDLLNFPAITSAIESLGTVTVDFDLDVPDGDYRLEFFTNQSGVDASGNGEGGTLVGSVNVTVTGGLPSPASTAFGGSIGDELTATATQDLGASYGSTSEFSAVATVTADSGAADLWLSTAADVGSPSGVTAVDSWSAGSLLGFGDPGLALGSGTTGGTLSLVSDFDAQGDGNVVLVGLHQVQSTITVGTSPSVTLQPGDLLFSVANNETFDNSDLSTTDIADKDVGLFRPDTPGDYGSGTFSVLLDQPLGNNSAVTLVERETVLPDITLAAGTFLLTDSKDVYQLVPTGTGDGISPGTPSLLLLGPDVGLDKNLTAIDLVEDWLVVGETVVPAGTFLVSMDGEDPVGSNDLPTTRRDVFALILSATTAGSGTGAATAEAFLVGGDVGMDTNNEDVAGLAIVGGIPATAPVAEDDAVNATRDVAAIVRVLDNDVDPNGDPLSIDSFAQGSKGTVTDNGDDTLTYTPAPGWTGVDTFTYTVTDGIETDDATVAVSVTPHSDPMAVYRRSGQSTPFYRTWDGSTFGGTQISASVGDFRIIQGAESPTRDEAIVVGVASGGTIAGEMWNGVSWTALPALGTTTQDYWWSIDVAYEPVSGDAIVVYTDGSALNYRVWNGSTWSNEAAVPEPPGGTPRQMQLAPHPWSDEMVLIVSNDSSQDYAVVWDGSAWGNGLTLDSTGSGNDRTDVYVAYEQQSGRALVVWGSGNDDVHFRVWDAGWSNEFATPGIGLDYARWITLGSDPNSDNIAMGVLTNDSDVWLAMWNGAGWIDQLTVTNGTTGVTEPAVAVAFESTSGQAIATYGEPSNTPRFRTWTSGSGWATEQSAPDIGAQPNSQMLYPEPGTDGVMLAVNDDSSDVHYLYWNGSTWGSYNELETSSGEIKNQPFLFLWEGVTGSPPPTYTISGAVFEDVVGDVLNDGTIGDITNPGSANVDVYLYEDDGDGNLDAGDTLVGGAPAQTAVNGAYSFADVFDGDYFVVVDSKTVGSSQDPAAVQGDIWAEQTYGPIGGYCDTGVSFAKRATAGPCYGGITSNVSDDFAQWDDREHRALVTVAGSDVSNLDFGFSFNVVTTTNGGNNRDDDTGANRTVQGSLRQFLQNANAISGANAMRFVPADPAGATDGGGNSWWRIPVTSSLPVLADASTTIDGTAYDLTDGTTVLDANSVTLGTAGDVGVGPDGRPGTGDEQSIAAVPGPELEIADGVVSGRVSRGIDTDADDTTIRKLAIWGFSTSIRGGGDGLDSAKTGFLLEDAVVGATATGADPGAEASATGSYFDDWSAGTIRSSYIAYATNTGATFWVDLPSWTIEDSHIESNGTTGIMINNTGSFTIGRNRFVDNGDGGLSSIDPPMTLTVIDNTFSGNTQEGAAIGDINGSTIARNLFENNTTTGLWIGAVGSSVADNTIRSNGGDGVLVTLGTSTLALARNLVENSGGNGVRLYVATGVTLTDNEIAGSGATGVLIDDSGAVLTTNTITGNTGPGVVVKSSADQITMDRNVFGGNGGIAIDLSATTATLGDGVTVNTATPPSCGTDLGVGNGGLDAPVIDDASATTVVGRACAGATVQVYRAVADLDSSDTSGGIDHGEGVEYVGTATADGSGNWTVTGITGLTAGDAVTATATRVSQTSEFSANFTSNAPPVFDQDLLDRTNPEADYIVLPAAATDPDGDTLSYSATGLPLGLSINSGTGMISGVVNHAAAVSSPHSVEISVTDGINPAITDTFTWTITNVATTAPYLVAGSGGAGGGDDLLTTADETNFDPATNEVDIGIGTGTSNIAAIAVEPISGVLFTADGSQLGILNTDGGTFTPVGAGLGAGDGEYGAISFNTVVGMSFHPLTGEIWAIHNRPGLIDVMFLVDPATGAYIPDAFGAGVDYRKLRQHAGASDFTGLAMDPTDWQLYGALTDGAGTDYLVSVSRKNGNTKVIGSLAQAITDLSFDNTGQMWAIDSGTLYQVTKTTAALDAGRSIDNGSAYEAMAFVVDPASPPALEGTVFDDLTGDALAGSQAVEDLMNPGVGGVTVHLYRDNGAVPGEPDPTDTLFDSKTTGPTGHYFFEAVPAGSYWLSVDSTSINPTAGGTGWAEQTYGPIGAVTYDGSYQFAPAAGPLFGGKQPTVSDAPADPATSEHTVRLDLIAGDHVEEVDLGFSFNVVTNLESGDGTSPQGSIRRFISNATTVNGPNAMRFVPAVPANASDAGTNGWWSLPLTVALPTIADANTTVDGTAHDPANGTTPLDPNALGPELELTWAGAAGTADGLHVDAGSSEVRDVVVNRFTRDGIRITTAGGNTVAGTYVGTDATGGQSGFGNNADGIHLMSNDNTVGGSNAADRNVVSGNGDEGIDVDAGYSGNVIIGNYVGTDASGAASIGNGWAGATWAGGVLVDGDNNTVGGSGAGQGNLISGNSGYGVILNIGSGNTVRGNLIGVAADGSTPLGNTYAGIVLQATSGQQRIGGVGAGEGNTIAHNGGAGILLHDNAGVASRFLGNSIHDNAGLGIDLGNDGVTGNDPNDADPGANGLLNFPVIQSAIEVAGTVTVDFDLDVPAGDYRIEFFTNSVADPSFHGEGESLTHAHAVVAHPGGLRSYSTTFVGSAGAIVTATTTADLGTSFGSTSEFSAAVVVTVPDTTPPVITLVGSTPIDVEAATAYVDAGATAWDARDGDLTASIVTVNPVNTAVLGSYTVTYNVSDAAGNAATEVTRVVNVVDTTPPVIVLNGANPQTIEAGTSYVELGATATDTLDGDRTAFIIINSSAVDTSTVGSYTVRYNVSDSSGNNAAEVTRTVNVVDTGAPVITLLGSTPIDVEAGSVYVDAGATAWDSLEGDLTASIFTVNPVNTALVGTYTITYTVSDSSGNAATPVTRIVNVIDTGDPVITLLGSSPLDVEAGSVYVDAGATAWDLFEGDLTASIFTVNPVNTALVGTYTITYTVSDSSGNAATPVTRIVNVIDTTAPVITLLGTTPIDVEAASVYVDAGATATDSFEGDLTSSIVTVNPVDTSTLGTYTVTYNVTDSTGNDATEVTRTVNVVDTTAPVITLNGSTPIDVEAGSVYVDAGATASDSFEGDLTGSIVTVNPVDTSTLGTYTVTYNVSDSSGNNAAEVTRTVNVVDTGDPVITLLGSSPLDVEAGSVYVDAGATAWDSLEGDLTASIFTVNPVNTALVGTYTITYTVSDSSGNAATPVTRIVNVVDTTAPVITLNGSTPIDIEAGSVYVDAGATAWDLFEGDLTASIFTVNPVNTALVGTYTITYTVSDSTGNAATPVTRIVNVIDTTAPVITLLGSTPVTVEAGSLYVDAGATATDSFEGDLTALIVTVNPVDTSTVGTYTVRYNVSDSAGNAAIEVTRTVNVVDTGNPVITLLGSTPMDVEAGTTYVDAGATAWDDGDGNLTASIVVTNPVDTGVLGTYTVRYNVTDSQGHTATEVTRVVNVIDTIPPVITLLGSTPIDVEAGSVYLDAGATAWDSFEGDLTASIFTVNPVNTALVGTYTITYTVSDSTGNAATPVTRIVNVVDTTAPVITLLGSTPIDVEAGTAYVDARATAWDAGDGDLTASIVTVNPVDTSTLGTYAVRYNVTDSQGNVATQVTRTVNVVDTTAPVITLLGSTPIDVEAGTVYTDAGATALDSFEGDLTAAIVTTNPVDTGVLGTYVVRYNVSDISGNAATEATRTVNVVDTTAPVITLLGSTPINVEAGSTYTDAGATAADNLDGDLTAAIVTVNPVDTGVLGTYTVTYNVTDSQGHTATEVTRTVNVVDTTAPVITLLGTTPIDVEAGSVYVDAGATASDSFEGDLTGSIFTVNPVNTALVGTYTITYTVSDSTGNAATPVTRIVNVIDTTAPVITLLGTTPIDVEAGSVYVDAGATAWDAGDGDLTSSIVTVNPVDTSTLGTYTVTHNVTDSQGHTATEVTRIVNVIDATAPVITLLGSTPIDVEAGSIYVDAGATATDSFEGDLTAAIVTVNPVNTSTLGAYTVTYNVTDSTGNDATEVTRTVNVVDSTAPVITLLGTTPIDVEAGSVYVDAGATASDSFEGDLTSSIVTVNPVDTSTLGTYTVTYNVADSSSNAATEVTRVVNVVDTGAPVITLLGSTPIDVEAGSIYVDAGATATDSFEGDLSSSIVTVNPVDTSTLGTYAVTYNVADSSGNAAAEVTRTVNVVDTTAPVITLLGLSPMDVEAGSVYVDAGTTAWDAGDGDLTGSIVTVNPVDTSALGTYTVTYNVTDSQGHAAAEVTRTVNVVDTTAPIITLLGSTPIDVEAGSVYVDAGATASDSFEGDLTGSIFVVNPVNTALVGTYTITYTVSDSTGNAATPVTRIVNVIDTTAPVITLLGSTPVTVEAGSLYVDAGATATDSFEGDLTALIVTVNPVDTSTVGTYTVRYNVSDSSGNAAIEVTRTVNVVDTGNPVITLLGSTPMDVEAGTTYVDAGATAWDDGDGNLTASIVTANPVDTSTLGTYTVRYNVTDSQGHTATEVTRTVNVVDTTAPVITLLGTTPIDVEAGSVYVDAGATAADSFEGDLTSSIFVVNPVNTALVGTYTITYTVSDSSGNAATPVTRIVNVIDTTAPVITLLGTTPIDVEAGSVYVDAGATAWDAGDGDLTSSIVTVNPVDTSTLGTYTVTYNVTDSQGHTATEVTRVVNVIDTIPPVITLNGANPMTVEVGSAYVEPGATATDTFEGEITASIVINNSTVDTSTVGTYAVTYDVADSTGNAAFAIRTVNVVDTGNPGITLLGSTPIDVEAGSVYVDAGATAWDAGDGDLTSSIVTVNPVDTGVLGTHTVRYNVSDSQGNAAAEVTRTVNVIDTTAPVITLLGSTPIDVEAGSIYVDAGATATDSFEGDLTASIFTVNPVNTALVGTYTITYTVSDSTGNAASPVTRIVNVVDTTPPVITLQGTTPVTVESGSVYVDAGATASDSFEGDLTSSIVTVNPVDTSTVGTYTVRYNVTDTQGNAATQVTRTVNVIDTTPPVVTLSGSNPMTVEAGSPYVEPGATASDIHDGDLTGAIVINNSGVDPSTVGSYAVTYDVTDSSGNPASAVRVVNVVDTTPPVITLNGSNPITIQVGSVYNELGSTAWDNGDGDITGSIVTVNPVDTSILGTYTVRYNVTDSQSHAAAEVTRTVNVVNAPPTLTPMTDRTVTEMTTLNFTATATDPDPTDPLTYSLAASPSGPSGPAIDPTTGTFMWRPTEAQGPGVFNFEIVVTDSAGLTDRTTVRITVTEAPRPPVLSAIADTTVGELAVVSFIAVASDPDVPASPVTYRLAGAPTGAVINANTGRFLWTPTEAQGPGSYTFEVVAADSGGLEDRESVTIAVTEANVAPVLQPIPRQTVDEGSTLTFTATATDGDRPANTLTFALVNPPFGASIDPSTGVFTWTPTEPQGPRTHSFSITVSDNAPAAAAATNASATQTITIDVAEANQAPVVETPVDRETAIGSHGRADVIATDPDIPVQQLTWSATGLPPGLAMNPDTGVIAGYVLEGPPNAYTVRAVATDPDGASGSATFTWTVTKPIPGTPLARPDEYDVAFGSTIEPTRSVLANDSDPEDGTLKASLESPPSKGTVVMDADGLFTYDHDGASSGQDEFSYRATDEQGLSSLAVVTITIDNKPPAPEPDEVIVEEDGYQDFDPIANDRDPEGFDLTIVDWTNPRNGGITTPIMDKHTLRYKPDPDYHGLDKFTYTVEDAGGLRTIATVTITVSPVNDAPVGVDDSFIVEDYQPMELPVLINDADVDGDPLRISRVSGAELGVVTILDRRSLTYDPTSGKTGIDAFTYTVVDGHGGSTDVKATVLIPESVLMAGEDLFDGVAPNTVEISAGGETDAVTLNGITIRSVNLMAAAFWQTVLALRVPMFFLLLAIGSVVVGGGLTNAPIFVAARRKRYYAGVLLHREAFLIAYEDPNADSEIVYRFQPTARSIHAAGRSQMVDGTAWIPVTTANGKGWINATNLVQEVDIGTFMEDQRPPKLVAEFVERLRNEQSVERLLSRPGLLLALAHDVSFVPASMAPRLAARDDADDLWPGAVAAFMSAYDATEEISPKNAHSSVALLPSECQNFLYLALEPDALGRPWLVYFEYKDKRPYIVGLGIDL